MLSNIVKFKMKIRKNKPGVPLGMQKWIPEKADRALTHCVV